MARATLLLLVALAGACSGGRSVRVTVKSIPAAATKLEFNMILAGHRSDLETFDLSEGHDVTESFDIRIPNGLEGAFWAAVVAKDANSCDVGLQTSRGRWTALSEDPLPIDLTIASTAPSCGVEHTPGMAFVPSGLYTIGCAPGDNDCYSDELPRSIVELPAFEIDFTEVPRAEYQDCMNAGVCKKPVSIYFDGLDGAQVGIDYERADTYCKWLGKRLPTEAEWEAGARGTTARLYPWGDTAPTCELANFDVNGTGEGCPVIPPYTESDGEVVALRRAGASPFSLHDMAGNVAEWVADWYAPRGDLGTDALRRSGPIDGFERVVKGGSDLDLASDIRISKRVGTPPDGSFNFGDGISPPTTHTIILGFRCARSVGSGPAPAGPTPAGDGSR